MVFFSRTTLDLTIRRDHSATFVDVSVAGIVGVVFLATP